EVELDRFEAELAEWRGVAGRASRGVAVVVERSGGGDEHADLVAPLFAERDVDGDAASGSHAATTADEAGRAQGTAGLGLAAVDEPLAAKPGEGGDAKFDALRAAEADAVATFEQHVPGHEMVEAFAGGGLRGPLRFGTQGGAAPSIDERREPDAAAGLRLG